MRLGSILGLMGLLGTAACLARETVPRAPVAPPPRPAPPRPHIADASDEATAMAVLRGHLLQLLPCDPGEEAELSLRVTVEAGRIRALETERSTGPRETADCVLSRITWWSFPAAGDRRVLPLTIRFPLEPPSINDHVAVLVPEQGRIDLFAVSQVLRGLRKPLLTCFRPAGEASQRLILTWLRLGEWGRVLSAGVEVDSGAHALPSRQEARQRERELSCLRRTVRRAAFPNPRAWPVELRFPYVLTW
jgi:hypothetical protein